MLGEALDILKDTAAPDRAALARELVNQIGSRATHGSWCAIEMPAANGGTAFAGKLHTLVVDHAGAVFKGTNEGVSFGMVNQTVGVAAWPNLTLQFK